MTNFPQTTCKISKALDLVGRHLFDDRWTGREVDADPDGDPDCYRRFRAARRDLWAALYHGHGRSWTVTQQGDRKYIPPDTWGPEGKLSVGVFMDVGWRTRLGKDIDGATSTVTGLLAEPNTVGTSLRELLRGMRDTASDSVETLTSDHRRGVTVYVDQGALEQLLRRGDKHREPLEVQKRQGRPRTYDWDEFHREVIRIANSPDGLPDRPADLERMMATWCLSCWGKEPVSSMIRKKISEIYQHVKKAEK